MKYEDQVRREMEAAAAEQSQCPVEEDMDAAFGIGSVLKKVGGKIKSAVYKRTPETKTTGEKIRIGPKGFNVTVEKRKKK